MSLIQVGIVEDDADWLRGLADYIGRERDMEVAWTAANGEQLREALRKQASPAEVVLMDIMLHGHPEGIALAEETVEATGARIIMLTSMEEKELIFRSFQAGAIDYQIKSSFEELPQTIRQAYLKQSPISAAAAERMREEFKRLKGIERELEVRKVKDAITPSELQLLELIDQGYTQPQIAEKLFITLRTVKNHVNHILKKLGLPGSKDAARKAKELGLLDKRHDQDSTM